ncbi:hypothetical protein [uncultured Oscillibacter sp.]|uniref:hypothetical protein n=1 Tax=uncultured Oscillibacter sp. TaxID=876091 RepID=UPI0025EE6A22|nr:hypothetical protein [uncultured Oscillibacter sp.]
MSLNKLLVACSVFTSALVPLSTWFHWRPGRVLVLLHGEMTLLAVLFAAACWRGAPAPAWDRWGLPAAAQRRLSRLLGALFLANAAVWPVGALVGRVVEFDMDFLLLAQIIGLPVIALLGGLPFLFRGKQFK